MLKIFGKVTLIFYLDLDSWPWTWHQRKGLTSRNTYMKYESSNTCHSNVMANFKGFFFKCDLDI